VPFDTVVVGGGASRTYDSTHTRGTGLSAKHVVGSRQNAYYEWNSSFGQQTRWYGRVYLWFDALPSGNPRIVRALGGSGLDFAIDLMPNGHLKIKDARNYTLVTTSQGIVTGGWVRLEWMADQRSGVVELRLFNSPNSLTPTEVIVTASGSAIGTSTDRVQLGRSGTQAPTSVFWSDDPSLSRVGFVGPVPGTAIKKHRHRHHRVTR
jgi:hypothetical protein